MTGGGDRLSAAFLIMATGCLSVPRIPDIPGIDTFAGEMHHTGLWPHDGVDVAGKRVGVIGTGSSVVQALPIIAAEADQVTVFQRTANFSVPAWNAPLERGGDRGPQGALRLFRRKARTTTAGNPWNARSQSVWDATPEERAREFEARYAVGGFCLHAAYADLFDDQASNDLSPSSCARRSASASRTRDGRGPVPLRPPGRHEADVRRHRLLRDLQPPQRAHRLDPRDADRRDHADRAARRRRASSRSTRSCSARASTR